MNRYSPQRRDFLKGLGLSSAAGAFLWGLPGVAATAGVAAKRQRLIFFFTPNGTILPKFWPTAVGKDFDLPPILAPFAKHQDQMLVLKGVHNKVRGDGDNHMRGMGCLLTGIELAPGNVLGGSGRPAGWAKGISIDQEIANALQANPATRTRFGSLQFGVGVPDRADPWTRLSYAGPKQPIASIDNPYDMFRKLYGDSGSQRELLSVFDRVEEELGAVSSQLSPEDRVLLTRHASFVKQMETAPKDGENQKLIVPSPRLKPGIGQGNDNLPEICRMQMDLMVNAMANDMARVASLQFTKSVGQAKMRWLGIEKGHHAPYRSP